MFQPPKDWNYLIWIQIETKSVFWKLTKQKSQFVESYHGDNVIFFMLERCWSLFNVEILWSKHSIINYLNIILDEKWETQEEWNGLIWYHFHLFITFCQIMFEIIDNHWKSLILKRSLILAFTATRWKHFCVQHWKSHKIQNCPTLSYLKTIFLFTLWYWNLKKNKNERWT